MITSVYTRILDVLLALILLATLAPIFVLIGILVGLTSPGPIFYTQLRYGAGKKIFKVYKFRTMVHENVSTVFKQATVNDARVTYVGKYLRISSMDELPQLINVLSGEMSLVGPRPHPTDLDNHFSQLIPDYERRYSVRPGITGLAQIRGYRGPTPDVENMHQRIISDIEFVEHYSIKIYLKILLTTPIKISFRKGRGV